MAHPRRKGLVADLLEGQLAGATVVWDVQNSRWDTGRRSMVAVQRRSEWHLVVQDDAILCDDFLPQVASALQHVRGQPVAFYMGSTKLGKHRTDTLVARADEEGACFIESAGPLWGPAIAIPTPMILPMLAWCDVSTKWIQNYDLRLASYFQSKGIGCLYTVPSLVDHRHKVPSLVKGRRPSPLRTAQRFGTREAWSASKITVEGPDVVKLARSRRTARQK